ncbi:MAG: hypothetical protein ACXVDD_03625, partial [Polyangia bacterium]
AIDFYRSYLRTAPAAPNRAEVERIVAELESALAQERAVTKSPPEGTLAAPPPTANPPEPSPAVSTTAPPAKRDKPLWKRGWVWGVVAGAAVVVAGVAIGVGVATSTSPKDPSPSLGRATFN